jgi:O-antigen/teichoic acid export membrane protein
MPPDRLAAARPATTREERRPAAGGARSGGWRVNFAAQLLALGASLLDRLVVVGLLLRGWGPETYAGWTLLAAAAGTLSLADLGMSLYFGNVWQEALARGDAARAQRALNVSLFIYFALGLMLALGGAVALGAGLADVLAPSGLSRAEATRTLALLGAAGVLHVMRGGFAQLYRAHGEFARGVMIDQLATAAILTCGASTAWLDWRPTTLAALYLAVEITCGWGLMLGDARRRFSDLRFRPALPHAADLSALAARLPWLATTQGAQVLLLQAPVLTLGATGAGAEALVSFVLARTMVNFARQIVTMLSIAVGVETAGAHHRGDADAVGGKLAALGRVATAAAVVGSAAILLLGEAFVGLWAGRPGLFDRAAAGWLAAATVIGSTALPVATLLSFVDRQRPVALAAVAQTLVTAAAALPLAPAHGAAGAAAALFLGECVGATLIFAIQRGALDQDVRRYACACGGAAAQATASMSVVAVATNRLVTVDEPLGFLVAAGMVALGAAPALFFALPSDLRARTLAALPSPRGL